MGFHEVKREQVEVFSVSKVHSDILNYDYPKNLPENLILPIKELSKQNGAEVKLYFPVPSKKIKEWREFNLSEDFDSMIKAFENILKLFEAVEATGYKIFCFDMKALYFDDELNPYILTYFPLIGNNDEIDISKFEMPIYINSRPLRFSDNNSRVLAEIFANLKYRDEYKSKEPRDRRRFVEESLTNERLFDFKNWFEKSFSNRYDIKVCKSKFLSSVARYKERWKQSSPEVKVRYRTGAHSIYGTGKVNEDDDFKEEEQVNQDAYLVKRLGNSRIFLAVMDGVSTSNYGDGNIASNLVKKLLLEEVDALKDSEINYEVAKQFYERFIEKANNAIIKEALIIDQTASPDGLMSTTFVSAILDNDMVYLCSVGDSPALLLTKDEIVRINVKYNVGFEKLVLGRNVSGDPNSLTQVIGKARKEGDKLVSDNIEYQFMVFKLLPDETLVLGSDGIIEFTVGAHESEKIENFRKIYTESYEEAKGKVKATAQRILAKIDQNIAGDNLTIVIAKPERNDLKGGDER
uniref:PPM-type phosphatase domain-containing protein n=1 Tax=Fervidobacterium thailandense TaxID=1008305 RepID=A0A7C4CCW3_9BACT